MRNREVRDVCIRFAFATTSRLERVALLTIALRAEVDESWERVALMPDEAKSAVLAEYLRGLSRWIGQIVADLRDPFFRSAGPVTPDPDKEN